MTTAEITKRTRGSIVVRSSSQLGVFVTSYLSRAAIPSSFVGSLQGIKAAESFRRKDTGSTPGDYELLQAIEDAIALDTIEFLNRSDNREASLSAYTEALRNVTLRTETRLAELNSAIPELKATASTSKKEHKSAEKSLSTALSEKQYDTASVLEARVTEAAKKQAEAEAALNHAKELSKTLETLIERAHEKSDAIEKNRELLLSGLSVIDVPGIDGLNIIERGNTSRRTRTNTRPESLLDQTGLP